LAERFSATNSEAGGFGLKIASPIQMMIIL